MHIEIDVLWTGWSGVERERLTRIGVRIVGIQYAFEFRELAPLLITSCTLTPPRGEFRLLTTQQIEIPFRP
jgi:hypothetical protein